MNNWVVVAMTVLSGGVGAAVQDLRYRYGKAQCSVCQKGPDMDCKHFTVN